MGARIYDPEVHKAEERLPAIRDPFAEKIAWMMDSMFRIGGMSIGLDGLLGLVPGLGDIAGALIGMIIVVRAVQAGIPRVAVARMVTNIAIDTLVGSIPIFGDAFDFAYKSNLKNLRLYENELNRRNRNTARHWGFFVVLFLAVGAVVTAAVVLLIAILRSVPRLI